MQKPKGWQMEILQQQQYSGSQCDEYDTYNYEEDMLGFEN